MCGRNVRKWRSKISDGAWCHLGQVLQELHVSQKPWPDQLKDRRPSPVTSSNVLARPSVARSELKKYMNLLASEIKGNHHRKQVNLNESGQKERWSYMYMVLEWKIRQTSGRMNEGKSRSEYIAIKKAKLKRNLNKGLRKHKLRCNKTHWPHQHQSLYACLMKSLTHHQSEQDS